MSKSNLTETTVHEAARKLDSAGVKPTIRAVRDILGEGSLTTIARFMQSYVGEVIQGAIDAPEYPPELESTWGAVWRDCYAAAWRMFQEEREELQGRIVALDLSLDEVGAVGDDLVRELALAAAKLEASEAEALQLRDQLAELRGAYNELKGNVALPELKMEIEQDGVLLVKHSAVLLQSALSMGFETVERALAAGYWIEGNSLAPPCGDPPKAKRRAK